jgi:retron-type reverse transcriptase
MDLFNDDRLMAVCERFLNNNGSIGIDGVSGELFKKNARREFDIIQRKIANNTYDFSLYKEKLILKSALSLPRQISIATKRDQLVLKILQEEIMQAFPEVFDVPPIKTKINKVKETILSKKYDAFLKIDVKEFYPSINHKNLMSFLKIRISDGVILSLIEKAITQTTVNIALPSNERIHYSNPCGVPQGLSISTVLSEVYLHGVDLTHQSENGYKYYRFVDDVLVLCNQVDAKEIQHKIVNNINKLDLKVHEFFDGSEKSSYGLLKNGVQFLGYYFKGEKITVRPSSIHKIYEGINRVFLKHHKYAGKKDVKKLYRKLNLKISGCVVDGKHYGWLNYFSDINDKTLLFKLDCHVKRGFKRFSAPYSKEKIKTFSRSYHEINFQKNTSYIPEFMTKNNGKDKNLAFIDEESTFTDEESAFTDEEFPFTDEESPFTDEDGAFIQESDLKIPSVDVIVKATISKNITPSSEEDLSEETTFKSSNAQTLEYLLGHKGESLTKKDIAELMKDIDFY